MDVITCLAYLLHNRSRDYREGLKLLQPIEYSISHVIPDRQCLVIISWLMMFLLSEKHW